MIYKIIKLSIACLLLLFAALQFNDPDPVFWIITYFTFAAICIVTLFSYQNILHRIAIGFCCLALFYSIYNWPKHWMGFEQTVLPSIDVEKARESVGLLLSICLTIVCIVLPRPKR